MFCEEIKLRVYKCIKSYFYSNNLISFVFNVSYFNRSNIFKEVSRFAKENRIGNEVLDVGCGDGTLIKAQNKSEYNQLGIPLINNVKCILKLIKENNQVIFVRHGITGEIANVKITSINSKLG